MDTLGVQQTAGSGRGSASLAGRGAIQGKRPHSVLPSPGPAFFPLPATISPAQETPGPWGQRPTSGSLLAGCVGLLEPQFPYLWNGDSGPSRREKGVTVWYV